MVVGNAAGVREPLARRGHRNNWPTSIRKEREGGQ